MNFLSRLRPIDIVLITALVLTAVVWVASSSSDGESSSISDVDLIAWQNARDGVSEAFTTGNLESAKASLRIDADEIGILIDLSGGTRFILRLEVGDSGREILGNAL